MSVKTEVDGFKRKLLMERFEKLTDGQRQFFWRVFFPATSVLEVPEDKLETAIDLCDRTIKKNEAGR